MTKLVPNRQAMLARRDEVLKEVESFIPIPSVDTRASANPMYLNLKSAPPPNHNTSIAMSPDMRMSAWWEAHLSSTIADLGH